MYDPTDEFDQRAESSGPALGEGRRQRGLEAIGSSVAEQNEQENQSTREQRKEILELGWVVVYRTTSYGYAPWGVKRVNEKSVRLRRPHQSAGQEMPIGGGTYPEYDETTADLDSDHLIVPDASESPDIDAVMANQPDGITYDCESFDTWGAWARHLMGDEWVEDNLDTGHFFDSPDGEIDRPGDAVYPAGGDSGQDAATDGGVYDPSDEWTDNRPQQDMLVETTAEGQAARDRGARVETGASEQFADDRHEEETTDAGEQAALAPETIDGQQSLTGEQATTAPEWGDESTNPEKIADVDDGEDIMNDWTGTVDYLRHHYSDDYQARIELASDLHEFASEQGMDAPSSLSDEGVLQPLIRYQNVDPADAKAQIENRAPSHHHDALFEVITGFAAADAARHDDAPDSRNTYDPCCEYDNPDEWGPTATRPISDVLGDLQSPQERALMEERRDVHESAIEERMVADEQDVDAETEAETAGIDPDTVYDPTEDIDPGDTAGDAVSEDADDADDGEAETDDSDDTDDTEDERAERIEFGSRPAANEFREEYEEYIHESDDRRYKTVAFEPDTPENVLKQAGTKATISQDQHKKYGQADLTDAELDRLQDRPDWSWNPHGFHAQATKALLLEEGGTPWLDYYDHTIEVDEHLSVIESGVDMAVKEGVSGPGEGRDDTGKTEEEIARDLNEAHSRMCRRAEDACEGGEEDACEALLKDCGYAEAEIAALMEVTRELGESPLDVYDPTQEADETTSFEEWAREQAPARPDPDEIDGPVPELPDPPTPDEPDDEELRRLAPARLEEMSGATLGALRKAWAGYKMARAEDRKAHRRMDEYAEIINGIRVVNDQEPIDFDQREGWDGGPILPEDPTEEYPVGDGTRQKSLSEAVRDGAAGVIEGAQATLGDTYDPTQEF